MLCLDGLLFCLFYLGIRLYVFASICHSHVFLSHMIVCPVLYFYISQKMSVCVPVCLREREEETDRHAGTDRQMLTDRERGADRDRGRM